MNTIKRDFDALSFIQNRFKDDGISIHDIETRQYPDETIYIVRVQTGTISKAAILGNQIDSELNSNGIKGFVTVRELPGPADDIPNSQVSDGIHNARSTDLISLLSARARTSEAQPSLSYIPDTAANISRATTARNHLVFGRRGAGKTSLLLETRNIVSKQGHLTVWINIQTLRNESYTRVFLWIVQKLCEEMLTSLRGRDAEPRVVSLTKQLIDRIDSALTQADNPAISLVPNVQTVVSRYVTTSARRIYIFLDDLHYLPRNDQALLLDLLHGCIRDCDAWLKVATIKHLTRWFQPNPPRGLQTGHDADLIDLDLTLQDPVKAKQFLEEMLSTYAHEVNIPGTSRVFSAGALDRLVLASGAVPRDYLVLAGNAIAQARSRESARVVGQQDVNKAAGVAAQAKITELEEDVSSTEGSSSEIINALSKLRAFCLDTKRYTYFRIDHRDRDKHSRGYGTLQGLMDVRLIHLVSSSVSDEHRAGEKSEVYMLDLSQFSGHRLKKNLKVLDFIGGHLVLSETGTQTPKKIATTANQLLAILRRAPLFQLQELVTKSKRKFKHVKSPSE